MPRLLGTASRRAIAPDADRNVEAGDDEVESTRSTMGSVDHKVVEAAQMANAHTFIEEFEDGYATLVGERGVQLSGGQKQRVAIARAIRREPIMLLLDEATSALDAESEHLVATSLDTLMRGRTTVIVAHRLSTVMNADMVVVLDNGHVAGFGNHESLVQTNVLYRKLVQHQLPNIPPLVEPKKPRASGGGDIDVAHCSFQNGEL